MSELTPKQQAFCDYYIETGNATEAAVKAGYSQKTAKDIGCENLAKPNLREYIDARLAEKESARVASQDEVLQFLTTVMRGDITESIPVVVRSRYEMVKKNPSISDRLRAAEDLGKRYGMFKENLQHSGSLVVFKGEDNLED